VSFFFEGRWGEPGSVAWRGDARGLTGRTAVVVATGRMRRIASREPDRQCSIPVDGESIGPATPGCQQLSDIFRKPIRGLIISVSASAQDKAPHGSWQAGCGHAMGLFDH
jgi:hypothetical protein